MLEFAAEDFAQDNGSTKFLLAFGEGGSWRFGHRTGILGGHPHPFFLKVQKRRGRRGRLNRCFRHNYRFAAGRTSRRTNRPSLWGGPGGTALRIFIQTFFYQGYDDTDEDCAYNTSHLPEFFRNFAQNYSLLSNIAKKSDKNGNILQQYSPKRHSRTPTIYRNLWLSDEFCRFRSRGFNHGNGRI